MDKQYRVNKGWEEKEGRLRRESGGGKGLQVLIGQIRRAPLNDVCWHLKDKMVSLVDRGRHVISKGPAS